VPPDELVPASFQRVFRPLRWRGNVLEARRPFPSLEGNPVVGRLVINPGILGEQVIEEALMSEKTFWESFKAGSEDVVEKLKALIREGNVRRVVIQHQGRTVAEFPLTAGVVGAALAPVAAAIGAIIALLKDCTIQVEREDAVVQEPQQRKAAGE
jgi:hypothetical protein